VHGGVVSDPVYLNKGTVLKNFVMSEKSSGPVETERPGFSIACNGP